MNQVKPQRIQRKSLEGKLAKAIEALRLLTDQYRCSCTNPTRRHDSTCTIEIARQAYKEICE